MRDDDNVRSSGIQQHYGCIMDALVAAGHNGLAIAAVPAIP
jgi:hypothetical protein